MLSPGSQHFQTGRTWSQGPVLCQTKSLSAGAPPGTGLTACSEPGEPTGRSCRVGGRGRQAPGAGAAECLARREKGHRRPAARRVPGWDGLAKHDTLGTDTDRRRFLKAQRGGRLGPERRRERLHRSVTAGSGSRAAGVPNAGWTRCVSRDLERQGATSADPGEPGRAGSQAEARTITWKHPGGQVAAGQGPRSARPVGRQRVRTRAVTGRRGGNKQSPNAVREGPAWAAAWARRHR